MENNLLEKYKNLYMTGNNTILSFDYNKILETYSNHLVLVIDELTESMDIDIELISNIVYGFSYFHSMVVSPSNISILEINKYIENKYKELENRDVSKFEDYSLSDKIFLKSCICLQRFEELGIKQSLSPLVYQMFANSYESSQIISKTKIKKAMN